MAETTFTVDKEKLEVRISRVFKAAPERVWQAYTDPKEVALWWRNTEIEQHDLRVGGKWRYIDHGKDGDETHAFRGEFKVIDEPRKLSRTFEYEPWAGRIMLETVTLEPYGDGQTLMTTVSKFDNPQDLENMVKSGMETGAVAGIERIAKLVEGDKHEA